MSGIGGTSSLLARPVYKKADALAGLFMSYPIALDTILARLKRKKALILQGPPGYGKKLSLPVGWRLALIWA